MTGKFLPKPTPDTRPFWDAAREERLLVPRCAQCGPFFYPRSWCPKCASPDISWFEASGRATLYSYVINYSPAAPGYEGDVPYVIAVVQLEEGPRMMANILITDPTPGDLPLDMPLRVVFEPRGDITIPQFVPMEKGV